MQYSQKILDCRDALINPLGRIKIDFDPSNESELDDALLRARPGIVKFSSVVLVGDVKFSDPSHPWALAYRGIGGEFLQVFMPMECSEDIWVWLSEHGSSSFLNYALYLVLLTAAIEGPPWAPTFVPAPAGDITINNELMTWKVFDARIVVTDLAVEGTIARPDTGVAQLHQEALDVFSRMDAALADFTIRSRRCRIGIDVHQHDRTCLWGSHKGYMAARQTLEAVQTSDMSNLAVDITMQRTMALPFGSIGPKTGSSVWAEAARSQLALIRYEASTLQDQASKFRYDGTSWSARVQMSQVDELFPEAVVPEENLGSEGIDMFRMRHVCVRDLAPETEYALSPGNSVAIGRRLELLTIGLNSSQISRLTMSKQSRFVATHLDDVDTLVAFVGNATFIPGLSLFWYDGHSPSARCPDCANIEHSFQDDAIADWVMYFYKNPVSVKHVVMNLHASQGSRGAKSWFSGLLHKIAADIAPVEHMEKGETLCFDEVLINFVARVSGCKLCSLYLDNSLFPGYSLRPVFDWVRNAVWANSRSESEGGPCIIAYGRQDGELSEKQCRWINMQDVVDQTGATLIDFRQLGSLDREIQMMRNARLMLTVVGAHAVAALFMRPGSTWVELSCIAAVASHWGKARPLLFKAMQIEYKQFDGFNCRAPDGRPNECSWLPVRHHPLMQGLRFSSLEEVSVCHAGQLCRFREEAPSPAGAPLEQNVIFSNVPRKDSCNNLTLTKPSLLALLHRCMEWSDNCWSVREDDNSVFQRLGGGWNKVSCTSLSEATEHEEEAQACLLSMRWIVNRSDLDSNLLATESAILEMRGIADGTTCAS